MYCDAASDRRIASAEFASTVGDDAFCARFSRAGCDATEGGGATSDVGSETDGPAEIAEFVRLAESSTVKFVDCVIEGLAGNDADVVGVADDGLNVGASAGGPLGDARLAFVLAGTESETAEFAASAGLVTVGTLSGFVVGDGEGADAAVSETFGVCGGDGTVGRQASGRSTDS